VIAIAAGAVAVAQSPSADEQAIRAAIAAFDRGERLPFTADAVQWSGAYKKPATRNAPAEEIPSGRGPADRVPGSRRNHTTPVRIEIAKSADLASEYSDGELSFELKSGQKMTLQQSILRTWRKENGHGGSLRTSRSHIGARATDRDDGHVGCAGFRVGVDG
jgi:hypothetical protein